MNNKVSVMFNPSNDNNECYVTNDSVMGGLSIGNIDLINHTMFFYGDISKDNNGGFTSVFQRLPLLSSSIKTVTIRVAGDGNCYQLRIKTADVGDGQGYKIDFCTTANVIETHTFKLSDFQASLKGTIIPNAPTLTSSIISHVGFLIASDAPKRFHLSIYSIEFNDLGH